MSEPVSFRIPVPEPGSAHLILVRVSDHGEIGPYVGVTLPNENWASCTPKQLVDLALKTMAYGICAVRDGELVP